MPLTFAKPGEANVIKKVGGREKTRLFLEKLGFVELRLDFVFEKKEEIGGILTCLKTRDGKYNPYAFETGVF